MFTRLMFPLLTIMLAPALVGSARAQEAGDGGQASSSASPQKAVVGDPARRLGHLEVPGDAYVPVPREGQARSPGVPRVRDGFVSVQVNVDASGNNIVGDAANEPSIAVDPTNPSRKAIGWRQFDTVLSNFRQAGWGYTTDSGQTWTFPGVIEPGVFRSDPVLDADSQGNFYYNSLTNVGGFQCTVYKSTDGGMTWDTGAWAYGGDKQWQVIDQTNGMGQDNIYAFWTSFYSICSGGGHFTRSYDGGQSFVDCTAVPGSPMWGTLAVGPDGELYIVGDGFVVVKSTTLQNELLPAQWDFSTSVSLDGSMGFSGGPNPGGLLGQAWIAVDHSTGANRGNVYLLCSVNRFSTSDPMDVMFARSTDGGVTWSPPVRVNDDASTSNFQWFGTMSVAPNGRITAIWNDTRNNPGGYLSELYTAYSEDAGVTWSQNEVVSPQFNPLEGHPQQNKMGDYFDMVSDNFGTDVAYAATFNFNPQQNEHEQDVYYVRIDYGPSPPLAQDVSASTAVSTAGTFTLNADDDGLPDPPAALTYIVTSLPAHGALLDPVSGPIATVPHTLAGGGNQVDYQPTPEYQDLDAFQYKANDGGVAPEGGDSNIAVVTITVGGPDWNPVALDMNWGTGVSVPTDITLSASDPNNDPLTYTVESLPGAGSLSEPGLGPITSVPHTLAGGANVVTYVPPFGQALQVTFDFSARDATAGSNVATVTVDIGAPHAVFNFLLDTNPGWSTVGQWAFGQPTGQGSGAGDPTAGFTGNFVYGYNVNGDYWNNMPVQHLTTPPLDCTYVQTAELQFQRWLGVEGTPWDHANIELSTDGTTWNTIWENAGTTIDESAWSFQSYDISALADGEPTVYIRWGMGPTDITNTFSGWNLDDIQIWGLDTTPVPPPCADLIFTPGDVNLDLSVDGLDIKTLVEMVLNSSGGWTGEQICAADFSDNGTADPADISLFVQALLN